MTLVPINKNEHFITRHKVDIMKMYLSSCIAFKFYNVGLHIDDKNGRMFNGATTLSITTLIIMAFSRTKLSIMTFIIRKNKM